MSGSNEIESKENLGYAAVRSPSEEWGLEGQIYGGAYDSVANLPVEFYHYTLSWQE